MREIGTNVIVRSAFCSLFYQRLCSFLYLRGNRFKKNPDPLEPLSSLDWKNILSRFKEYSSFFFHQLCENLCWNLENFFIKKLNLLYFWWIAQLLGRGKSGLLSEKGGWWWETKNDGSSLQPAKENRHFYIKKDVSL